MPDAILFSYHCRTTFRAIHLQAGETCLMLDSSAAGGTDTLAYRPCASTSGSPPSHSSSCPCASSSSWAASAGRPSSISSGHTITSSLVPLRKPLGHFPIRVLIPYPLFPPKPLPVPIPPPRPFPMPRPIPLPPLMP